uniref:Uncharacterized protein n=1 Tax=Lepeophtheirus salmonis TaxID=72036 RepID=A0A0K2T5Y8_LEPSM
MKYFSQNKIRKKVHFGRNRIQEFQRMSCG